jgi:glycosyltransferase involved in cell wall biosynthesis
MGTPTEPGPPPQLSFVVPAWNEERWLGGALAAIDAAATALGRPFEVIVADDASTDRTAAIARAAGAVVVPVSHRQIAATRNSGARAARGDYLIFVDADTTVNAAAVRGAVAALDAGAVGGGAAIAFDGRVPLWTTALLKLLIVAFRRARLAGGSFFFCRRADFEAEGGFDERFYASEEIWLAQALKRRGPFVILREAVETSARKVRAYGGFRHFTQLVRLTVGGERALTRRAGLDLWYEGRRDDPGKAAD